jgi:hypothetical protein
MDLAHHVVERSRTQQLRQRSRRLQALGDGVVKE